MASQLRDGVPCWTAVVGDDSGGAITAACVSVTSSLTSTATALLFSSSSLFYISCTSASVIRGWEGIFSSTVSATMSSSSSSSPSSSSSSSSSAERFVAPERQNNLPFIDFASLTSSGIFGLPVGTGLLASLLNFLLRPSTPRGECLLLKMSWTSVHPSASIGRIRSIAFN